VGSGKNLIVTSLWLGSSVSQPVIIYTSSAALTTAYGFAPLNKKSGGAACLSQSKTDSLAAIYSAGAQFCNFVLPADTSMQMNLTEPLIFAPGTGVVIAAQTAASVVRAVVEFYEEGV
jgi:hypothetical protein